MVSGSSSDFALNAIVDTAKRQTLRLAVLMGIVNLLFPPGVFLYADLIGKDWWYLFWSERGALTWFSSIQLLLIGIVAYANHRTLALLKRLHVVEDPGNWIWLVFTVGFIFLGLDEGFHLHEDFRDKVLRPSGLLDTIPYVGGAEVILYFYFLVGVVFAVFLIRQLYHWPLSLVFFGAALALALATVTVDSLGLSHTRRWPLGVFWNSIFEETGEIWAQYLFLLAFLVLLRRRFEQLDTAEVMPDVAGSAANRTA